MEQKPYDTLSLAHTSWKCQYHIVFAPKYRRKVIYGKLRAEIGKILRELCERKHVALFYMSFQDFSLRGVFEGNRKIRKQNFYMGRPFEHWFLKMSLQNAFKPFGFRMEK